MKTDHVTPFLDAMHAKVIARLGGHLRDDVVVHSPFVTEPFVGRDAVVDMLRVLLSGVDTFETTAVIAGEDRAAVILRIRAGDTEVTGVDDMGVDADGLITSMSIQWRPLAGVVAIQQRLAPLLGVPALELVEKRLA